MTPQKLLIKIEGLKRKRNDIIDEVIDLIKQTGL